MVAAKVANIKATTGKRSKTVAKNDGVSEDIPSQVSIEQAAEQLSVSKTSVKPVREPPVPRPSAP